MASLKPGAISTGIIGHKDYSQKRIRNKLNCGGQGFSVDGFNETCNNISASYLKVGDDSTSAIRFRTTAKGDLPEFSYIYCKPEPLGKEFKTVACSVTGALLFVEI